MRAYLFEGNKQEYTAPAGGVVAGLGYVIGANTFVIAEGTAAAAAKFIGVLEGVFRLPKNTSDAITEGQRVFWDNTAKTIRTASASGRFMVGTAVKAQNAADATCDVRVDGISVIVI